MMKFRKLKRNIKKSNSLNYIAKMIYLEPQCGRMQIILNNLTKGQHLGAQKGGFNSVGRMRNQITRMRTGAP